MRSTQPVLVSAHRCGAGGDAARENTREALLAALDLGVDFVEIDVQRCADGTFVLHHDDWVWHDGRRRPIAGLDAGEVAVALPGHLGYAEALELIRGRARAHLDLKFTSPDRVYLDPASTWEVAATRMAVDVLGDDGLVVTTLEDSSVRAVRDWSEVAGLRLLVGLSLGRSVHGLSWRTQLRIRVSELLPRVRLRNSRANVVVAKHTLARLGVAAYARRRGLPLLVWTVDTEPSLRYWMRPGRAWLVTSNQPALALRTRAGRLDA